MRFTSRLTRRSTRRLTRWPWKRAFGAQDSSPTSSRPCPRRSGPACARPHRPAPLERRRGIRARDEGRPGRPRCDDRIYNLGEHSGFAMTESPVYQRMLAEARAGEFAGLVARDSSRLGRDYWEKLGTLRDLRAAKVELHVLEDGGRFDFEDRMQKVKSWASTWSDDE